MAPSAMTHVFARSFVQRISSFSDRNIPTCRMSVNSHGAYGVMPDFEVAPSAHGSSSSDCAFDLEQELSDLMIDTLNQQGAAEAEALLSNVDITYEFSPGV